MIYKINEYMNIVIRSRPRSYSIYERIFESACVLITRSTVALMPKYLLTLEVQILIG